MHMCVMIMINSPNKERDETRELRLTVQQRMRELLSGADYGKTSSAFVFCLHVCTIEGGKLDPGIFILHHHIPEIQLAHDNDE